MQRIRRSLGSAGFDLAERGTLQRGLQCGRGINAMASAAVGAADQSGIRRQCADIEGQRTAARAEQFQRVVPGDRGVEVLEDQISVAQAASDDLHLQRCRVHQSCRNIGVGQHETQRRWRCGDDRDDVRGRIGHVNRRSTIPEMIGHGVGTRTGDDFVGTETGDEHIVARTTQHGFGGQKVGEGPERARHDCAEQAGQVTKAGGCGAHGRLQQVLGCSTAAAGGESAQSSGKERNQAPASADQGIGTIAVTTLATATNRAAGRHVNDDIVTLPTSCGAAGTHHNDDVVAEATR